MSELFHDESQENEKIFERALRFIAYRPRTASEVRKKLLGLDYPARRVEQIIEMLISQGFIDDALFAKAYLHERTDTKKLGLRKVIQELRTKGIDRDTLETLELEYREEHPSEKAAAMEALEKKYRRGEKPSRDKCAAFLARNGYSPQAAFQAAKDFCGGSDEILD